MSIGRLEGFQNAHHFVKTAPGIRRPASHGSMKHEDTPSPFALGYRRENGPGSIMDVQD
jgi:hypothetical protein